LVYRIDDQTNAATLPALPADNIGQPGFFTGGAPGISAPTRVRYWWLNMVQEEFAAIVAAGGLPLDKGNNGQAIAALKALFGYGGSPAATGWQRMSGGVILQWSFGTTVTGNQDPRYFPLTFPNACFAVVVNEAAAAGWNGGGGGPQPTLFGVSAVAANGFYLSSVRLLSNGVPTYQSLTYNYLAIGR